MIGHIKHHKGSFTEPSYIKYSWDCDQIGCSSSGSEEDDHYPNRYEPREGLDSFCRGCWKEVNQ